MSSQQQDNFARANLDLVVNFIFTRQPHKISKYEIKNKLQELISWRLSDCEIYQELRLFLGTDDFVKDDNFVDTNRTDYRITEIMNLLAKTGLEVTDLNSMLDIGCAEGSITAAIGQALNLEEENIHGCDIRDVRDNVGFKFSQIIEGEPLPYADNNFSVIFCLMVLHHIDDYIETIKEAHRLLKPGGYFIIREHDCISEEIAIFLDLVHGLYALTLNSIIEDPNYCKTYQSRYFYKNEIIEVIKKQKFKLLYGTNPIGNQRTFFAVFQKIEQNYVPTVKASPFARTRTIIKPVLKPIASSSAMVASSSSSIAPAPVQSIGRRIIINRKK